MRFIGQEDAKKEIELLAKDIALGNNHNIVIEGKTGYGKTTLARYLANKSYATYQVILGSDKIVNTQVLIIDEAHTMNHAETLYNIMDSHTMSVVILTTELGLLPEPLLNRCIHVRLKEYTFNELILLAEEYSKNKLSLGVIKEIVNRSRGVPRNITTSIEIVLLHQKFDGVGNIKKLLDTVGIYDNGYTDLDYQYLDYLKQSGPASIATLVKVLGIPRLTLENYIEPFLLKKNRIQITTKGRKIV